MISYFNMISTSIPIKIEAMKILIQMKIIIT